MVDNAAVAFICMPCFFAYGRRKWKTTVDKLFVISKLCLAYPTGLVCPWFCWPHNMGHMLVRTQSTANNQSQKDWKYCNPWSLGPVKPWTFRTSRTSRNTLKFLRCFGPLEFCKTLGFFRPFGALPNRLEPFGPISNLFEPFGTFWNFLEPLEPFWTLWHLWNLWSPLESFLEPMRSPFGTLTAATLGALEGLNTLGTFRTCGTLGPGTLKPLEPLESLWSIGWTWWNLPEPSGTCQLSKPSLEPSRTLLDLQKPSASSTAPAHPGTYVHTPLAYTCWRHRNHFLTSSSFRLCGTTSLTLSLQIVWIFG